MQIFWFSPPAANFAILVKIEEDDGCFGVWLDEPVGHAVARDELFSTASEALDRNRGVFAIAFRSLSEWRKWKVDFIASTGNTEIAGLFWKEKSVVFDRE